MLPVYYGILARPSTRPLADERPTAQLTEPRPAGVPEDVEARDLGRAQLRAPVAPGALVRVLITVWIAKVRGVHATSCRRLRTAPQRRMEGGEHDGTTATMRLFEQQTSSYRPTASIHKRAPRDSAAARLRFQPIAAVDGASMAFRSMTSHRITRSPSLDPTRAHFVHTRSGRANG